MENLYSAVLPHIWNCITDLSCEDCGKDGGFPVYNKNNGNVKIVCRGCLLQSGITEKDICFLFGGDENCQETKKIDGQNICRLCYFSIDRDEEETKIWDKNKTNNTACESCVDAIIEHENYHTERNCC